VQLQQRRNRLYKANSETYQSQLKYFLAFIDRNPYLRSLIQELQALHPEIDLELWKQEHASRRSLGFPDEEAALAKLSYGLVRECAEQRTSRQYAFMVSHEHSLTAAHCDLTERLVYPLVNYLHDRVDEGSNLLSVVEKYKRRTEWFHRDELLLLVREDPRRSERILDTNLREYLFDQGIDYPFSTPSSPSGEADIVADVGDERPLVLEIKLFDPERGYDRGYIRQGFRQIYNYASDYGQSVDYLVVFNCSPKTLVFRTKAERAGWPPRIEVDYRTFFLVVVDLMVHETSASKRGPLQP
jgi:hypothetical protein